jgi:branched-chain amino acid transport system substrate-binding protein
MRRFRAALAALLLLGTACRGLEGATDAEKPVVKVAFLGALSEDFSPLVVHQIQAAQLAFALANESGSLPAEVELVAHDTEGSTEEAVALADEIAGDPSYVAVIEPDLSEDALAAGDRLDRAGIARISASGTLPFLSRNGWTSWFRVVADSRQQVEPLAEYIIDLLDPDTVCVVGDGYPNSDVLRDPVARRLRAAGLPVPLDTDTVRGQEEYSGLAAEIDAAGCEALFFGGRARDAALLMIELASIGRGDIALVGANELKDDTFPLVAEDVGDGAVATCPCADVSTSLETAVQQFISDYQSEYGTAPGIYGAEAWDASQLLIAALRDGGTGRKAIVDFLRSVSGFPGLTKVYAFEDDGDLVPEARVINLFEDRDGRWIPLGSSDQILPG